VKLDHLELMYNGFRVFSNHLLCTRKLIKKCRSKKRRIVKKWGKNPKNYVQVPDNSFYRLPGNILVAHPVMVEQLRKLI